MTDQTPTYPVEKCKMTHTEPYDFAQCQTHDTTFALGTECKYNNKTMVDVLADEADEQRGLKMRALTELDQSKLALGAYLTAEKDNIDPRWLAVLREHGHDVPAEQTDTILEALTRMNTEADQRAGRG